MKELIKMAVRVTLNKATDTLEFRPENGADNEIANYLCKLVREAKTLAASADAGVLAKSGLTGMAYVRKAQEDKIRVLKDIADREDEKSRRADLSWELRQLANQRSFAAKEELRQLTAGLEGR